jgi:hypothetical protein
MKCEGQSNTEKMKLHLNIRNVFVAATQTAVLIQKVCSKVLLRLSAEQSFCLRFYLLGRIKALNAHLSASARRFASTQRRGALQCALSSA